MVETESPQLKKNSILTPASFEQLLSHLGPDRERAAETYLELQRALFTYFAVRGATAPEEFTDETFDRAARRLSEGQSIFAANPTGYFYGVARNVWRESLAKTNLLAPLPDEASEPFSDSTPLDVMVESLNAHESERRLACLQKCLARFPDQDRELVIGYYQDSGGAKIEARKLLAARLGLSLDSLRHKLSRLRLKLGTCVKQCMESRLKS